MSDISGATAKQIAEAEISSERREADVDRFKDLFRRRDTARKVLRAIDLEIEDLEAQLSE